MLDWSHACSLYWRLSSPPQLKIVTLSANKLLGQLGQATPLPQEGFQFNHDSHNFRNSVVLILSHSGGTFASLACT